MVVEYNEPKASSEVIITETVDEQSSYIDPYAPVEKEHLTFMQRKLLRLQQEHLSAFEGNTLGEIAAPKLSRLEQDRKAALELKAMRTEKTTK